MHVNSVSVRENDNRSFVINHVFVYIESMTEWEFKYVMKLKATQKPVCKNMTVSEDVVLWFVHQLLIVDVLTVVHDNVNAVLSDDELCLLLFSHSLLHIGSVTTFNRKHPDVMRHIYTIGSLPRLILMCFHGLLYSWICHPFIIFGMNLGNEFASVRIH